MCCQAFNTLKQIVFFFYAENNLSQFTNPCFLQYTEGSAMRRHLLDYNAPENNRFQGESQNLCREIFMARITILVYSILLVMIRKASLHPQVVNDLIEVAPPLNYLVKRDFSR
jgi:hypothetical protein